MARTDRIVSFAPCLLWALAAWAPPAAAQGTPPPNLALRNTATIAAIGALWAGYGYGKWWNDGFGGGFRTTSEGWFGTGTDSGGADKLGHMFSNYASVRLLTPLFTATGNSREEAIRLAGWTTIGIFTAIEVLDGYSRQWDFSPQDAMMNVAGTALGVYLESHPEVDDRFDFRFAYRRSKGSGFDPFGDYSGQRYLLVVKADGFGATRRVPALRYLELSFGYQARGFEQAGGDRRRDLYVGVSLNLSRLLADGAYGGQRHSTPTQRAAERAFELLQFPTAVYARTPLN